MDEMVKRAVRKCVVEHMMDDVLARDDWNPSDAMMEDVCPGTEAPQWLRDWNKTPRIVRTKHRLENMRFRREADRNPIGFRIPESKTVEEILRHRSYEILGKSERFDTLYHRKDCFVIRIQYGRDGMAMADYEVGPTQSKQPVCWQD